MAEHELPFGVRPPGHRVDQPCDSCHAYDRHPRHIHNNDDGSMQVKHMDCCARDGCPDGSCPPILQFSGRAHGDDLIAFLESTTIGGGK